MSSKINKIGAALITGGAKRVGREIALNLAKNGYDIAIHYKNSVKEAESLAKKIRKNYQVKCEIFFGDLFDLNQTKKLAKEVLTKFPHCNLLVNNASIFNESKFLTASDSEMVNNLNTHLISPLILSKEFAKNVLEKNIKNAQIINLIDKNIARFDTNYFFYLFSKKTLAEFTKMLSLELAPQIRVNGIAPGIVSDPIDNSNLRIFFKKIPLQRRGETENIIQTVEFLLTNNFVTGQILFIDGGASLNHAG